MRTVAVPDDEFVVGGCRLSLQWCLPRSQADHLMVEAIHDNALPALLLPKVLERREKPVQPELFGGRRWVVDQMITTAVEMEAMTESPDPGQSSTRLGGW